ncbi:16366_t:CDS:2, partial [Gigaspora rosea]
LIEVMDDVEDVESAEHDNSEFTYPISLEMEFTKWNELDHHSEKDKNDGIPRCRTYKCIKGRPYILRKEVQAIKEGN